MGRVEDWGSLVVRMIENEEFEAMLAIRDGFDEEAVEIYDLRNGIKLGISLKEQEQFFEEKENVYKERVINGAFIDFENLFAEREKKLQYFDMARNTAMRFLGEAAEKNWIKEEEYLLLDGEGYDEESDVFFAMAEDYIVKPEEYMAERKLHIEKIEDYKNEGEDYNPMLLAVNDYEKGLLYGELLENVNSTGIMEGFKLSYEGEVEFDDISRENGVAEAFIERDMKLSKNRVERVLDSVIGKGEGLNKHDIKIEMVNKPSENDMLDMDDILDEMTQRLCEMMNKGADGIYL